MISFLLLLMAASANGSPFNMKSDAYPAVWNQGFLENIPGVSNQSYSYDQKVVIGAYMCDMNPKWT